MLVDQNHVITSPVIELSFTVIVSGAHRAVSLSVNCASGLCKTVIVSETIVLSHPLLGSPTVSSITYRLSIVCDVLVSVNIGVDTLVVNRVVSNVAGLSLIFHTFQLYDPIELLLVVSVVTVRG